MLKVIAEGFIKVEAIETVLPLYQERVEVTKHKVNQTNNMPIGNSVNKCE